MANPERLDAPLRIVSRPHWITLAAIGAAIVVALIWAIVTKAPVKLAASGILIDRAGLIEVVADEEGKLQTLDVAPGDVVAAGQPIATLSRAELGRQLGEARSALHDAEERLARVRNFYDVQNGRQAGADVQRLATIAQTRTALTAQLAALEQKRTKINALVDRGFISRDDLLQTQIAISDTQERIAKLGEEATGVNVGAIARQGQSSLALLDEQKAVDERRRALDELQSRLSEQQTIRAQSAGRVVEVKVNGGDVVGAGSAIATLAPVGKSSDVVALLYVPAGQGKRIRPGMRAEIAPSTVERAEYGYIRGTVASVAPLPSTAAGMRRVLRNDQLVEQLLAGGAPIEVRVALDRDPSTRTGLAWSASKGPAGGVTVGTLVEGHVVVDYLPIIAWLVPSAHRSDN
jgi:HlyD family secretion protein